MKRWRSALVFGLGAVLVGAGLTSVQATAASPASDQVSAAPSWPAMKAAKRPGDGQRTLDTTLIRSLKSKDHTAAVKKLKIKLVSAPSRTLWTSTYKTTSVPMLWEVTDPGRVAKRIRICVEDVIIDDYRCKSHELRNYSKGRGDFWMKRTKSGWDVFTAPYWKPRSPYQCSNHEFYRPKMRWSVSVVDPRNGDDAVTARFGWTVRCSG